MTSSLASTAYTSSNLRKHTNANPIQRWLLNRFHLTATGLLHTVDAATVLDAGCGEGFAMREVLARTDARIVGLDGSVGALQVASALNPARSFTAGDLLELPFPGKSFELVVCMEVLEHLDHPERGLAELCRVSGRWLLLSVPNEPLFRGANFLRGKNVRAWGNDPGHINHWSSRAFVQFAERQCRVVAWQRSFPWTIALCCVD